LVSQSTYAVQAGFIAGQSLANTVEISHMFGLIDTSSLPGTYASSNVQQAIQVGALSINVKDYGVLSAHGTTFDTRHVLAYDDHFVHIFNYVGSWQRLHTIPYTSGNYYLAAIIAENTATSQSFMTESKSIRAGSADPALIGAGVPVLDSVGSSYDAPDGDFIAVFECDTLPSADTIVIKFRIQDNENYWQLTIDSSGVVKLDECVAGTLSNIKTTSGTYAILDDTHCSLIADDTDIRVYSNQSDPTNTNGNLLFEHTTATNFRTATGFEIASLGTGGVMNDMYLFERYPSTALCGVLDRIAPA